MGASRSLRRLDWIRIGTILLCLLLVAPLGYGIPYLVARLNHDQLGFLLLALLTGPSVWAGAVLVQRFQPHPTATGCLFAVGCGATILCLLLIALMIGFLDEPCERWSFGCNLHALWPIVGLIWASIVAACLWSTQLRGIDATDIHS